MYEVELKFRVADAAALGQALVAAAARFREPVEQVDRYFAHPCRDFSRTDEALRLRRVGEEIAITWKGPRIDTATKTREEMELPLPSAGAASLTIARWTALLEALGFRRVREVSKRRWSARVPWQGAEVEVALDSVSNLGDFLELELQVQPGEVPQARSCIESLARHLGCAEPERRSYLELLIAAEPVAR